MSFYQIRGKKALKNALCVSVLVFSTAGVVAPQVTVPKRLTVTPTLGFTGAAIQQALDCLPEAGGEVVLPAGTFQAWKVQIASAEGEPGTTTLWIDKKTRRVVKNSTTVPQMGGAVITLELQ